MPKRLVGKKVVVTGATSGLGYAMADALLGEGAQVAIGARPGPRLEQVVARWQSEGKLATPLPMDVRSEETVVGARDWIAHHWGDLDLLVNNAGIGIRTVNPNFLGTPEPFFAVSTEKFRDLMDTNLTGYFIVSRVFMRLFLEAKRGRFVNVTMNHETMIRRGFVPYGPSRAGAEALSLIMTEDLRDLGITVNQLLPGGATDTGMIPETVPQAVRQKLLSPTVMAEPIIVLASDAAAGITGERIVATDWESWKRQHGF